MNTHARLDLAPPAEAGSRTAVVLSLLAHLLLGAALAWGVNWTQSDPQVAFSAELWSPSVQAAAPAAVTPPPPPPPPPAVKRAPPPPAPPPEARPPQPQADIALEREKKRKLEQERKKADALKEKAEKEKAEKDKAEKDKLAKEKADKARKDEEARKLKDKERELAKAKEEARKEEAAQAAQDKLRQEQVMQRIQGMAGATGSPDAKGTALRASAPSASYAGKIIEQIKNNTSFTDANVGHPSVVVLVKTSSSGLILSRRVVTSSGNKAWDEAVLRAVDKMANVPRDTDGRIPEVLLQDGLEIKVTL